MFGSLTKAEQEELERAHAQGRIIQYWDKFEVGWRDCIDGPMWSNNIHYRIKSTKPIEWKYLSIEEQNSLAGAWARGETIEYSLYGKKWYKCNPAWAGVFWDGDVYYRVKPKEFKNIYGYFSPVRNEITEYSFKDSTHRITFQTVDGKPDWSTLKGEKL